MKRRDSLNGMLMGAFLGDAIALGPHWIYDVARIKTEFGEIKGITTPLPDSYHKNKHFGDFTHYGDLTLMLLDYLIKYKAFDQKHFMIYFREFMTNYNGYKDHAMLDTLSNLNQGIMRGSSSDELGGAARMAAPLYVFSGNEDEAIETAISQCSATHRDDNLLRITRFLAKVATGALSGVHPIETIESLLPSADDRINDAYRSAKALLHLEADDAIPMLGQMCSSKNAFPSVLYLLLKYNLDFSKTLFNNVQAGGDSAARGMILGTILGAWVGQNNLPEELARDMNGYGRITELIKLGR